MELPADAATADLMHDSIAACIAQAGFTGWSVTAGTQEISITLQRHLHWNRIEKMSHDAGAAWIRVYPRHVAAYDDVLAEVEAFAAASQRHPQQ